VDKLDDKKMDNEKPSTKGIKKDDFIEIEYTGMTKEDEFIFDTTDEKTAKENMLHNPQVKYGSMIICVGERQLIKGLDEQIIGKEPGQEYEIEVQAEDAFGKKQAKHIQLVNTSKFKKQNINPVPGMQVTVDDTVGTVKTVTGGRTLVDFNHPLASKDLLYKIKINSLITDDKVKVKSFLTVMFGPKNVDVDLKEGKLTIKTKIMLPEQVTKKLDEKIKTLVTSVKKIEYIDTSKKK
jgi:FKBP-type peptidyl-prolyl cis-trans isomerase 2